MIPASVWIKTPPGAKLREGNKELKRILKDILIKKKEEIDKAACKSHSEI